MADSEDVLNEIVNIDASQAVGAMGNLKDATAGAYDQFMLLMQGLGVMNGNLEQIAENTQQVKQAEDDTKNSSDALSGALQQVGAAMQVAFGLGVYQIVSAIVNQFKEAITYGLQFSQAMYELNTGVNELRASGVDVTLQNMTDAIAELAKQFPNIAIPDFTKLVAQITFITSSFGATKDEITDLARAAAIANQNTGSDITSITTALIGAVEDQTGASMRRLANITGITVSSQQIYNEAVLEGVAGQAKTYDQLDENARLLGLTGVIIDDNNKKIAAGSDYSKTQAGEVADLSASWKNVLTVVGQLVDPWLGQLATLITNITPAVQFLVQAFIVGFQIMILPITTVAGELAVLYETIKSGDWADFISNLVKVHQQILDTIAASAAPVSATAGLPNTPSPLGPKTPSPDSSGLSAQDQLKVEADMEKQIIDLHDSEAAALEKIATNLGNKLIDITTKYDRAIVAEDVQAQNQRQKIYDQTAESLATAAEHERLSDLEAQQKYQEDLQNLMDSFQANLEDALRARDAKTVIHLIEEYDNQKIGKARQYKDEQTLREENYKQEIEDIKRQEQSNLQELAIQVAERKAALKVQADQEAADAKLNAQRQTDAETVDINNRIKAWEDGLKLQYDITDEQMKNIYNDVNAYLGKNGYIDQIYTYIIERMAQVYAALGAGTDTPLGYGHGNGMAAGGSLFANKPTSVTFGEAGPELAMFLPLGSNFGSPSASFAGGGGAGGSLQLQLLLDPNLEARIVQTSLNNVALTIDRVQRQS